MVVVLTPNITHGFCKSHEAEYLEVSWKKQALCSGRVRITINEACFSASNSKIRELKS